MGNEIEGHRWGGRWKVTEKKMDGQRTSPDHYLVRRKRDAFGNFTWWSKAESPMVWHLVNFRYGYVQIHSPYVVIGFEVET